MRKPIEIEDAAEEAGEVRPRNYQLEGQLHCCSQVGVIDTSRPDDSGMSAEEIAEEGLTFRRRI